MDELLVVKQDVRKIKQILAKILDVLNKGNINVPLEGDGVFQRGNPPRPDFSGDVDAEVGVNIGSDIQPNSDEGVIFGSEDEDVKNLEDKPMEDKDPNYERVSGEKQHLAKSEGVPKNDDTATNIDDHVHTSTIANFGEDKSLQVLFLEEELQNRNFAVHGYEIENASERQSEDLHVNDPYSCMIVSGLTETKKYYTRKHRSVGPLLRSPYEEYKNNRRKRKASKIDQPFEDILHGSSHEYYNVHKRSQLEKYLHFISWLHKSLSGMMDNISVGCPSKGRANAIWFHRFKKIKRTCLIHILTVVYGY